jgi:AraC-like DNA-binding protein
MQSGESPSQASGRLFSGAFNNPDTYVSSIAVDSARSPGLVGGPFQARLGILRLGSVNIAAGSATAPVAMTGESPDMHVFTLGPSAGPPRRASGQDLSDDDLFHFRPAEGMSSSSSIFGAVSIQFDAMAASGPAITGRDPRVPRNDNALFTTPPGMMPRLFARIEDLLRLAEASPTIVAEPAVTRTLAGSLVADIAHCLTAGRHVTEPAPLHRRRRIIAKLIDLMNECPEDMLSSADVCQKLAVPERTLNLLCQEFLGMSMMRYVRACRMDQVRRRLLATDPARANVTTVATQFGFWDLGRFAQAYRERYGELPSRTIQRSGR